MILLDAIIIKVNITADLILGRTHQTTGFKHENTSGGKSYFLIKSDMIFKKILRRKIS